MYRASDHLENERWLEELDEIAEDLDLPETARSRATDLFLSTLDTEANDADRSRRALVATSVYAGALVAGEERSQRSVADAADVSRLTIQQRWKSMLEEADLTPPNW